MSTRDVRNSRLVKLEKGLALSKAVRSNSTGYQYDPRLQDLLDDVGQEEFEATVKRYYHGLVVTRS